MSKQVNDEEGDLGKPIAGQKRDLGKRLDLNEGENVKRVALGGTGEKVAGRRVIILVDGKRLQCGLTNTKGTGSGENSGTGAISGVPVLHYRSTTTPLDCSTGQEGSQDPLPASSESDGLRDIFLEWAEKLNRKYESKEEEDQRFEIWLSTKNRMEKRYSRRFPGYKCSPDKLNLFADRLPAERAKMKGGYKVKPFEGPSPVLKRLSKTEEGLQVVEKTRIEFNEWAARHNRDYGSEEEEERRFSAYLDNKLKIELCSKVNPGYCWIYGYDLEIMDKFVWEASLTPSNLPPRDDAWARGEI